MLQTGTHVDRYVGCAEGWVARRHLEGAVRVFLNASENRSRVVARRVELSALCLRVLGLFGVVPAVAILGTVGRP